MITTELPTGYYLILDTETTGVRTREARIVQISIMDSNGKTLLDTFVNPKIKIPKDASRVHGITDETVDKAPTFYEIASKINRLILDRPVAVYNVEYDKEVLECEMTRLGLTLSRPKAWHCVMKAYSAYRKEWHDYFQNWRWFKLGEACEHEGIKVADAHHALGDCKMTKALIERIRE